jgi:hypothetical protein
MEVLKYKKKTFTTCKYRFYAEKRKAPICGFFTATPVARTCVLGYNNFNNLVTIIKKAQIFMLISNQSFKKIHNKKL